jgi:hypothetical protein
MAKTRFFYIKIKKKKDIKSIIIAALILFIFIITIKSALSYDENNYTFSYQGRLTDLNNNSLSPGTLVRIIMNDSNGTEYINEINPINFYFGADNSGFDFNFNIINEILYNELYSLCVITSGESMPCMQFRSPFGLIQGKYIKDGSIQYEDLNLTSISNLTQDKANLTGGNIFYDTQQFYGDVYMYNGSYLVGVQTLINESICLSDLSGNCIVLLNASNDAKINVSGKTYSTNYCIGNDCISSWEDLNSYIYVNITNNTLGNIVGVTTTSYDGDLDFGAEIGYVAGNSICNSEFSGSHFCYEVEILNSIKNNNYSWSGTAWYARGAPGYTANADDCAGWTTNSNVYLGPFWNWDGNAYAGYGRLTNCAQTKTLLCCR